VSPVWSARTVPVVRNPSCGTQKYTYHPGDLEGVLEALSCSEVPSLDVVSRRSFGLEAAAGEKVRPGREPGLVGGRHVRDVGLVDSPDS
jgi:hypothetical protein